MKSFFNKLAVILSLIFAFCFTSCSTSQGGFVDLNYFNTLIRIETHDKQISSQTQTKLKNMFSALENEFDRTNQNSFVNAFNNGTNGQTFSLSNDGAEIMNTAKQCYEFSKKSFDPTVYPLVELWQFAPNYPVLNFKIPDSQAISNALSLLNFESVVFDQTQRMVTKTDAYVKLDFSGIVKGYSADKAAQILIEDGHSLGYVNVGGSSLNILSSKTLSIRHPRATPENSLILTVNLQNKHNVSVSTSGDYEKTYISGEKTYCHIIDTKTGQPITTCVASVTLIGVDGATADALTTAACTFTHDPENKENSPLVQFLTQIIVKYSNCSIYAVYDDGNVHQLITNEKKDENFTLLDTDYNIVNI